MRKFWLTNADSETVYLTNMSSNVFLQDPAGLGFSNTIGTTQYGDALVYQTAQNFDVVTGTAIFYSSTLDAMYSGYREFIDFLSKEPLVLHYEIPTSTPEEYTMDVAVNSIQKTEVKEANVLSCELSLQSLSRWKGDEVTVTGSGSTYTITNDGHIPAGFEITITGSSMENPYFTLSNDDGMYGEGKFDGTFDSVHVDSRDGRQDIELEQGGSILPDPLSYQDLSISNGSIYVTFTKFARGNTTLAIGMDSGTLTSVTINFVPLYRSV